MCQEGTSNIVEISFKPDLKNAEKLNFKILFILHKPYLIKKLTIFAK
jgi:hypothetical protein